MKKALVFMLLALMGGVAFGAVTTHFAVDCRNCGQGTRLASAGSSLTVDYSPEFSEARGDKSVRVLLNGEVWVESAGGGAKTFTFGESGLYQFTHQVLVSGVVADVMSAFYAVDPKGSTEISISWTEIPAEGFKNWDWLTTVEIPNSVKNVGADAFAGCENIRRVVFDAAINDGLASVASLFPDSYDKITEVTISGGLEQLDGTLLAGCAALEKLVLPDSVKRIAAGALDGLDALQSVTLPSQLEDFGLDAVPEAQRQAMGLRYDADGFMIWNGWLLDYRYRGASALTVPNGVVGIGHDALAGMYDMATVLLPSSLKYISTRAFAGCSYLDNLVIPDSVNEIGEAAFADCSWLASLTMGAGVKTVAEGAFAGCTQLKDVEFGSELETIGARAFDGCWRLQSVALPLGVKSVDSTAFSGCTSLTGVTVPTHGGKMSEWFAPVYGEVKNVTVPRDETEIRSDMFAGCSALQTVDFPNGITSIGARAFQNCWNLTEVVLPQALVSVGERAFAGCSALRALGFPENVERIGTAVCSGCSSLADLSLSKKLTEIPDYAFENCSSLDSFVVPAAVTRLGKRFCTYSTTAIYYLGDAPAYDADAYGATYCLRLTSYVIYGTKGWDGRPTSRDLPQSWLGRAITTWKAVRYDVAFDANGGVFAPVSSATYGCEQIVSTGYSLPPFEPTRMGHKFNGYWTQKSGGARVTSSTVVTALKAHTLYAQWQVGATVEIRFNANGGTVQPEQGVYTVEEPYGELPVPTRTGYTFSHWALRDGTKVTAQSIVPQTDVTLYAVWTPNRYVVRFDANGGEGRMADQAFEYDVAQNLVANTFVREERIFGGWAKTQWAGVAYEDGAEIKNLTPVKDEVVTLYAKWLREDGTSDVESLWGDTDKDFSAVVANTYDGYMIDEDHNLLGVVQVKTTKQSFKKDEIVITATATVTDANGKKWSYSKGSVSVEGEVTGLKCTKKDCPVPEFGVTLGKNGLTGEWDGYRVFGARNGMGVKGDAMMTALEAYKGKWSVAICGDWKVSAPAGGAASAEGLYMPTVRLQLNVQAKGVVKVVGNWETGEKVSASAQLVMGDGFAYLPLTIKATKTTPAVMALLRIEPGAAATGMSPPQAVTLVSGGELIAGGRTVASLGKVSYLESEISRGGAAFSARVAVDELAYPAKFSAKGLPAGLKINAATGVISGTPTKPGFYTATVTVTSGANSKVKRTLTVEFEIENYTDDLIPIADAYGPYYVGVAVEETVNEASGCSVSGLPSGLKWAAKNVLDSKTKEIKTAANTIYGVPTKVGTSTVYFKESVTEMVNGKQKSVKHQASATVYVEGMKPWAVGTFNGGGDDAMVTLTVGKTGKLSGKWLCGGKTWTLSAASFNAYAADSEVYYATLAAKCGKETSEVEIELTESGVVAFEVGSAKIVWEAWRNAWKETSMKDLAAKLKGKKVTVGEVTLTVGANGAVSAKGSFVTGYDYKKQKDIVYSATCSTVLIPGKTKSSFVVYLYFPPKAGKLDGFSDRVEVYL